MVQTPPRLLTLENAPSSIVTCDLPRPDLKETIVSPNFGTLDLPVDRVVTARP